MWIAWLMTDRITALADRPSYTLSNSGALIISVLHSLLKNFSMVFSSFVQKVMQPEDQSFVQRQSASI